MRPLLVILVAAAFSSDIMTTTMAFSAQNTALEALSKMTVLSIDSGDLDTVEKYAATGCITDATTNPLFVSQAGANGDERYEKMVLDSIQYAKEKLSESADIEEKVNLAIDKLAVNLGAQLLELVPGKVSTEVDIRLSFDTEKSIERARNIISMYEAMGIDKSRVLIKLAGTWEGIQAAKVLESEGIQCNITLIFSFWQAVAAAQAGAYLISPFPGRILDWHKKMTDRSGVPCAEADAGVLACKRMYGYFRKYAYDTICMPASWRPSRGADVDGSDVDEILALAGCDEMTIPPPLLESLLKRDASEVSRQCVSTIDSVLCNDPKYDFDESSYMTCFDVDECGKEKLTEGINAFITETEKLREILIAKLD